MKPVDDADVVRSMAIGLRLLAAYELDNPMAGVLTAVLPSGRQRFICNPVGLAWELATPDDLLTIERGQTPSETGLAFNELAAANNLGLLDRPGVGGVVHVHAPAAIRLAAIGRRLEPFSQEACIFYDDHDVIADRFDLDFDRSAWLRDSIGSHKVLAIANHGLVAQGATIDEAVAWAIQFEEVASQFLSLLALGTSYSLIPNDAAAGFHQSNGTSEAGWLQFQTFADLTDAG